MCLFEGGVGFAQGRPDIQTVEAFFNAIAMKDTNTAARLLEANTNLIRSASNMSKRPLLEAAAAGNVPLARRMLELGADVNAAGDILGSVGSQRSALHFAISRNHAEMCRLLLESGANPNAMAFGYETPLHLAFRENREPIATLLLDHGADPFREKGFVNDHTTPFEMAITHSSGQLVPRILSVARKPGASAAIKEPFARLLLARGSSLLAAAAQRGQLEAVETLLEAGVKPGDNVDDAPPLLQTVAPAFAAASKAKDFSEQRWSRIRELLEKSGAKLDVFSTTGWGDLAAVRRFVFANPRVIQARDDEGATPLHWAIKTDRPPMTSFWLESGASPAATNLAGQTPLHLAVTSGLVEQVKLLLAANTPTAARDTNNLTPLDIATKTQHAEIIRLLLGKETAGARPERGVVQAIHKAAEADNLAALAALADEKGKLELRNELGFTPLAVAVRGGNLGAAALLVDKGADVNARDPEGNTLLQQILTAHTFVRSPVPESWLARAAEDSAKAKFLPYLKKRDDGDVPEPIVQLSAFLLAAGADVAATNNAGRTIVQMVANEEIMERAMFFDDGREEFMKLLNLAGGKLSAADDNGDTPLHLAGRSTDADQVKALIAGGADINATNRRGRTPLHSFVEHIGGWDMNEEGDNQPFQCLLKHKPNVNAQDNDGLTPLHVLAQSDTSFKEEATEALLAAGADPNLRDKHHRTPAHFLLTGEWPWSDAGECLALLAKRGADLSAADDAGQTLLHYLAKSGNGSTLFFIRNITNLLTLPKLDVSARDIQGDTALHVAARSGASDVFAWLVARGASPDATNNASQTPRLLAARNKDPFSRFNFNASTDIFQAIREDKLESVADLVNADKSLANETNQFGLAPLRQAVLSRRTNIVDFLEKNGARWDAMSAVMAGRSAALREILARDPQAVHATAYGQGLLHRAAADGDVVIIQMLLSAGAGVGTPNDWGLSPLGSARLAGQPTAVTALLRAHGAAENFFDAVFNGDTEISSALLADKPELALSTNRAGQAVVEVAASRGPADSLRLILDRGAKADFVNPLTGRTLVHIAAKSDQADVIELLIQRGASVELPDGRGFAPLHLAAAAAATRAAAVLLRYKAGPDVRIVAAKTTMMPPMGPAFGREDITHSTPLHVAAMFGQTNMIPLLLQAGASVNATNAASRTPLDMLGNPAMSARLMFLQRDFGLGPDPVTVSPVARENPMSAMLARRAATTLLLEQAGGRRSPNPRPGFGPPGF